VNLLRLYLEYSASGGTNLGEDAAREVELNAFEIDVHDALTGANVPVVPQLGVSGFRIDFAAQHPTRLGLFVLAIECDGATYHSSDTARDRDRLRQAQLEALGWTFHRIWSGEWFHHRDQALQKVVAAYASAVLAADGKNEDASSAVPPKTGAKGSGIEGLNRDVMASERRGPRPRTTSGLSIDLYQSSDLIELADWIESDGRLLTEDEVLLQLMAELGFHRRGKKIDASLRGVIRAARARRGPR
jgi:very-short-patch-repair endonuclease